MPGPKGRCPVQVGKVNRGTDMNELDSAIFCPTFCNQEAQSRAEAHKADLLFLKEFKNTTERQGRGSYQGCWAA